MSDITIQTLSSYIFSMPVDDIDSHSLDYCSHCKSLHSHYYLTVETFCIDCLIKANRCQLCKFRPPDGEDIDGQRVERLLREVRKLREIKMRLEREKIIQVVTLAIKRRQLVSDL